MQERFEKKFVKWANIIAITLVGIIVVLTYTGFISSITK